LVTLVNFTKMTELTEMTKVTGPEKRANQWGRGRVVGGE
jgi:hypothetical protein